mgnify:CR=1 FL=1
MQYEKNLLYSHTYLKLEIFNIAQGHSLSFFMLLRHGSCVYGNFLLETCSCVCSPVSEVFYHSKCFCVTTLKSERERDVFLNYIMLSHVLRDFEIQDDYGNCVVAVCALQLLHSTDDAPVFVGSIKQFGGIECRKILTVCIKNIIA